MSITAWRVVFFGAPKLSLMILKTVLNDGRVKTAITIPSSPSAKAKRASGRSRSCMRLRYSSVLPCLLKPMAVYSSSTRLSGMIELRNSTIARGRGAATRKYDQLKPKTTLASFSVMSTASTTMPRSAWISGSTIGSTRPPRMTRPTR